MAKIYFDVSDIIHHGKVSNRLTGIPRVQLNLVSLLAYKHGGDLVRCVFFDPHRKAFYDFDLTARPHDTEFDAEGLLIDLGLQQRSAYFPGTAQIKTYLRRYENDKTRRTLRKIDTYLSALFMPGRLRNMGLNPSGRNKPITHHVPVSRISEIPSGCCLTHLGAAWYFPQIWQFAQDHRARGGDVVQLVHDLIPITHPHYMTAKEPIGFAAWMRRAFHYTSRFAAVSVNTAKELQAFATTADRALDIHVMPLAHEFIGFDRNARVELPPPQLRELAGKDYVLCVGTIEARKNGINLLRAWQQLIAELGEKTPLLLFAGRYGRIGSGEFQAFLENDPVLSRFARVVDAPADQALAWLYGNCLFSAYPSHVEGWGLPVGESAWFGKLCLASKTSSVPEVCGALMDYVDPTDVADIVRAARQLIGDRDYLQQREQAIRQAPLRRWADVADDLYGFIQAG